MYQKNMSEAESLNFCELSSELTISYNGHFVDKSKKSYRHLDGAILTQNGKVMIKEGYEWAPAVTPEVFLFYDNKDNITYLVDKCKKTIVEIVPYGRILDCTDLVIYEIKDEGWCPICDLSGSKKQETVVKCTNLTACEGFDRNPEPVISMAQIMNHKVLTSSQSFSIHFEVVGEEAELDSDLSDIRPNQVNLENGTLDPNAVPTGKCKVLIYHTWVCGEGTMVYHIFSRATKVPSVSAKCGQFLSITDPNHDFQGVALPERDACCPEQEGNACLVEPTTEATQPPLTTNLVPIADWSCVNGTGFNAEKGCWTVPQDGKYDLNLVISLCTVAGIQLTDAVNPSVILVQYPAGSNPQTTGGVIVGQAPVNVNVINTPYTTQAVLNLSLNLKKDDLLCIYYVDRIAPNTTVAPNDSDEGYRVLRASTSFNAHYVTCLE